jgi:hypothetical protein
VVVPGKSSDSELLRRLTTVEDHDECRRRSRAATDGADRSRPPLDRRGQLGRTLGVTARSDPSHPRRDAGWVGNPIDAFVLARLEKEGLKPR